MVCKNCGADLKPGIKYCLECGNYIDESEYRKGDRADAGEAKGPGSFQFPDTPESTTVKKKYRKKKKNRSRFGIVDLAIYGALGLVIIVSVIIIIVTLLKGNGSSNVEVSPTPTVIEDKKVTLDFYSVVVPGGYNYDISNSFLYVSDDTNYTFSYKNTTDDYNKYSKDLNILTAELEENKYEVSDAVKEDVGDTEFLIYKLKDGSKIKYLYLTPASKKYTSVGVIEVIDDGEWKSALPVIAKLNNSVEFDSFSAPKDPEEDEEDGTTTTTITESSTVSSITSNLR